MPATPAWPPKSLPRLFVTTTLGEGARVELDATQANYLGNVLRMKQDRQLLLFDGASGEWLARIAEAGKKHMALVVEHRTRAPETMPDLWLAFAPVKRARIDWLVEKATELGAARLIPVMTQRTVVDRLNLERLAGAHRRSRRAVRPDSACPSWLNLNRLQGSSSSSIQRARSISPTRKAASRRHRPSGPAPRRS